MSQPTMSFLEAVDVVAPRADVNPMALWNLLKQKQSVAYKKINGMSSREKIVPMLKQLRPFFRSSMKYAKR